MRHWLTAKEVNKLWGWVSLPKRHRRLYIAQNGRCPYCGRTIERRGPLRPREPVFPGKTIPSIDHVRPHRRGKGHNAGLGNRVLACAWCNHKKGDRDPYACEVLFAEITAEIYIAMLPPRLRPRYAPFQSTQESKPCHLSKPLTVNQPPSPRIQTIASS